MSLKGKKGKSDKSIINPLHPITKKFNSSNVAVNKKKSSDKDKLGGRHGSSRDDADRGRDA
jgi:hypothetical protein